MTYFTKVCQNLQYARLLNDYLPYYVADLILM